jgi:hypothetical protein
LWFVVVFVFVSVFVFTVRRNAEEPGVTQERRNAEWRDCQQKKNRQHRGLGMREPRLLCAVASPGLPPDLHLTQRTGTCSEREAYNIIKVSTLREYKRQKGRVLQHCAPGSFFCIFFAFFSTLLGADSNQQPLTQALGR